MRSVGADPQNSGRFRPGLAGQMSRLGRAISIVRDFKNWTDVILSILTDTPLAELRKRDGTLIVAPARAEIWNHYNDIWNHRAYTKIFGIPTDGVVIDIGANVGLFSLLAARTAATVYAFEPSSMNFSYLMANTRNVPNVSVHQFAVGGFDGRAALETSCGPTTFRIAGQREVQTGSFENVEVRTIATIFSDLGISHCDFMKLDCEGSEYEILMSAEPSLLERVSTIVFEFHDHLASTLSHADLLAKLTSCGYKTVTSNDSGYGIIAAQRGSLDWALQANRPVHRSGVHK